MAVNGRKGTTSTGLGVTDQLSRIGEFANRESMNAEHGIYTFVFLAVEYF